MSLWETTAATYSAVRSTTTINGLIQLDPAEGYPSRGGGCADCLIRLWDTDTWKEVSTLKGSQDEVWGMAFSSDGKTLFSSGKDGKVLVWSPKHD